MELQKKITSLFFAERDRFVLFVPVLLGLGAGIYFLQDHEPGGWLVGGLASLLLCLLYILWRSLAIRLMCIASLIITLGFTVAALRTQAVEAPVLRKTLYSREVQGVIDDILMKDSGEKLILKDVSIEHVQQKTTPRRVSISFKKNSPDLKVGDRIRIPKTILFPPPAPAMPGGYDFARAFYFDRIGAVGYSPAAPEMLQPATDRKFEEKLTALRLSLSEHIMKAMGKENGPVAAALMVGEQSAVSEEVADAMRDAGIYHVLSISGLHMAIAAGLMYVAVRFLLCLYPPFALRWPVKKIAAAVGFLSAFAYLLLSGYPVPAIRSFVMVACVMTAILFDRRGISVYALAWAAVIILLAQPDAILGASFQLSFAATLAIIALYERFGHVLYKSDAGFVRIVWYYFLGLMATSLAATLATTPLVIYHFNRITLWGVAANMLMVPLASFWIMPAAILAFLMMPFGLEALPLAWLDQGIRWLIAGARWFASLPHAAFSVPSPTFPGLMLIIFGGLWLCLWRQRWRLLGVPLMILGLATIALHKPYDLLINDEASVVAARLDDGQWLFIRGKPDSFDGETWLEADGQEQGLTLADMKGRADDPTCNKETCSLLLKGRQIIVALRKQKTDAWCNQPADLIVTAGILEAKECQKVRWRVDQRFLWANGVTGFRFEEDQAELSTAAQFRGSRPWVPKPYSQLYHSANPAITKP